MLCLVSLAVGETARGELVVRACMDRADVSSLDLSDIEIARRVLQINQLCAEESNYRNEFRSCKEIIVRVACKVTRGAANDAAGCFVEFESLLLLGQTRKSQEPSSHNTMITFLYKGVSDPS